MHRAQDHNGQYSELFCKLKQLDGGMKQSGSNVSQVWKENSALVQVGHNG